MIRYVKLFLFSFLFILFGFVNYSYGLGATQLVGLTSSPSALDSNYSITFLKGGGLKTEFLGYGRGILAPTTDVLFWWTPNGLPYVYYKGTQGFFDRYYSCDEITTSSPENCSLGGYLNLTGNDEFINEIFTNFFRTVNAGDRAYYDFTKQHYVGATLNYDYTKVSVCFSSSSVGKSICFKGGGCSATSSNYCNSTMSGFGSLINSQGYENLTFSNLPTFSIGPAPGQSGYGISTGGNAPTQIVDQTVTDNDILQYYEKLGFNSSMCYVDTTDLNSEYGTIWSTSTSGQSSIFEAFSHLYNRLPASDGYNIIGRWIDFWIFNYNNWFNTNYNPPFLLTGSPLSELWEKTYTGFVSPFIGQPAFIYFYINELEHEGSLSFGTERYGPLITQYCDIKLNGTNSYPLLTGSVETIVSEKNGWWNYGEDGDYQNPTQGYNGGSSGFWDNNPATGTVAVNTSFKQFYSNLSDMLSGISVSGNGIIPNYILFFLAFIVLVRLLKK